MTQQYLASFPAPWGTGALAADTTGLTEVFWEVPADKQPSSRLPSWLRRLADQVTQHLDGNPQTFQKSPIAWHLWTPFQRHVYQTLLQVPAGEVVTYGDLAEKMGMPSAARAVANALGANQCPIVIPCHRVIRSDGSLGGFSAPGGVKLKKWLLKMEGVVLH